MRVFFCSLTQLGALFTLGGSGGVALGPGGGGGVSGTGLAGCGVSGTGLAGLRIVAKAFTPG